MTDPKDQEIERLRSWLHRVLYETGCTRGQHTTQWCEEARVVKEELAAARAEIERLRTRFGWLDHLDTEEGRKLHANEALLVEIEEIRIKNEEMRAARAEIERLKAELQECRDLLRRFTPHCEDLNHLPESMHDSMEPCPLERRFKEASRG